jgi:CxxC motif-containing protein
MTRELVCITCPLGCHLAAEIGEGDSIAVSGNRCGRGAAYAREELLSPKRVVTATCRISRAALEGLDPGRREAMPRRAPCRTTAAFPRERVTELLELIYGREVGLPVRRGEVLVADALGTGIDVIAARTIGN